MTFTKWVLSVLAGAAAVSCPAALVAACWATGDNSSRWGGTGAVLFFTAAGLITVAYMAWALD